MKPSAAWEESFVLMRPWVAGFNSQGGSSRKIGVAMEIQTRLQHLHFERERLKEAYDSSLEKIRSHETNLISSLRALGTPESPAPPNDGVLV